MSQFVRLQVEIVKFGSQVSGETTIPRDAHRLPSQAPGPAQEPASFQ